MATGTSETTISDDERRLRHPGGEDSCRAFDTSSDRLSALILPFSLVKPRIESI